MYYKCQNKDKKLVKKKGTPSSIMISLLLQLMKATVLSESSSFLSVLSRLFMLHSTLQT